MDHGCGFKNKIISQFFKEPGIRHILTPVADHRCTGLIECTIQTINWGTEKVDPNFGNLNSTLLQILEDIRKTKYSVLKKSPFELYFSRKTNTEFSQAFNNIVTHDTLAQGFDRKLLTPAQIASQDSSRDRVKVVPRGSSSSHVSPRFDLMFSVGSKVSESEPYKILDDLAKGANAWALQKRNLPLEKECLIMRQFATRHSNLANSLQTGLIRKTLRFYSHASDPALPALSHS